MIKIVVVVVVVVVFSFRMFQRKQWTDDDKEWYLQILGTKL